MNIKVVLNTQNIINPVKTVKVTSQNISTQDPIVLRTQSSIAQQDIDRMSDLQDLVIPTTANTGDVIVYNKETNKYEIEPIQVNLDSGTF